MCFVFLVVEKKEMLPDGRKGHTRKWRLGHEHGKARMAPTGHDPGNFGEQQFRKTNWLLKRDAVEVSRQHTSGKPGG